MLMTFFSFNYLRFARLYILLTFLTFFPYYLVSETIVSNSLNTFPTLAKLCIAVFTGSSGKLVDLESTIKGFDAICKGEYDHLPEAAFYMVGTIEEAIEKAEKMAKEAAA